MVQDKIYEASRGDGESPLVPVGERRRALHGRLDVQRREAALFIFQDQFVEDGDAESLLDH